MRVRWISDINYQSSAISYKLSAYTLYFYQTEPTSLICFWKVDVCFTPLIEIELSDAVMSFLVVSDAVMSY